MIHAARQLAWHLQVRRPLSAPMWLRPWEAALFDRMAPADQFEGLAVASTLEAWGWGSDRDLLLAGLLHDAGKSLAPPGPGWRVLMTLLETFAPAVVRPLGARVAPVAALANHASAGAALAAEAGLPSDVIRLIAEHHSPASDARGAALQRADALH